MRALQLASSIHHHFDPQAKKELRSRHARLIEASLGFLDLERQSVSTLKALQSLIFLLFSGLEGAQSQSLFDVAVRSAQAMGLHRLGNAPIEDEGAVRSWWLLVARSWITATQTGTYAIHASQFSTRRWVILPSERQQLHQDEPHGWTTTSFLESMLTLADVTRRSVDLLNAIPSPSTTHTSSAAAVEIETRKMLARNFVDAAMILPEYYSFAQPIKTSKLANRWKVGDKPRHSEERCVLQQYIFTNVARLHVYEMCSETVSAPAS